MSKARRLLIWEKEKGVCYLCQQKVLAGEAWEAEHVKCWELYQDDTDENLKVAHKEGCHREKTNKDVKIIRKADRQAGNKGQWARRQNRGHGLIRSGGFDKTKTRGFNGKVKDRCRKPTKPLRPE